MIAERRLLVVEPDAELREALREIVSDLGIVVDAVADLSAAEVELGSSVYALVLADVDARPYDFAAGATRLVRAAAPVRVVAMTALPFDEVGAARAGVVAVLPKPFSVEQLMALVAAELPPDPDHDCRVLVDAYFDALARGDWDALGALCTADVVYELPGETRFSATVRGRAAFREFAATTFRQFPEPSFAVQHLLPIVDGAIVRYRGSWRGAAGPLDGAVFFSFEGPFIRRIKVQLDLDRLLALAPAAASPG